MLLETTALISVATWLGKKVLDKGFDKGFEALVSSDRINKKFYKTVDFVSKKLQKKYPTLLGGSIDYFFKDDTIFGELIKLMFKNSMTDMQLISDKFDIKYLPPEFIFEFVSELKQELLNDKEFDEIFANKELYVTVQGISRNLEEIAKNSNITRNDIERISKIVEDRIGKSFSYGDFHKEYFKKAHNNLSQVNFLGLGVDISIPRNTKNLKDIFIKPSFRVVNKKSSSNHSLLDDNDEFIGDEFERLLSYGEIFNGNNNLVILGNPGSGKSVLVKSVICSILSNDSFEFSDEDIFNYLPFRIELRRYLSFKKENRGNIVKYLASLLEEEYGISNITEHVLDTIFRERKCFAFFDGLDEIFKVEDKIEVKNDIENFHISYGQVKSLTTSRIIGYEEARLEGGNFCELIIQNFTDKQVNEYVRKWYLKEEENVETREEEVNGFIDKKNEIDEELITNPLLLSLIVILYRNVLKLPESKLEIYQSCTKTLVDKWDASKNLAIDLDPKIYKDKEKIFADLAYWQYKLLSSDSTKITYEKAKLTVAKILQDKLRVTDEFSSLDAAESFMSYSQKRSIYFDNNFTHKTFLEYYTAYWIYSNIEKKHKAEERDKLISDYISNPFWFIVLELLVNLIDKDQPDNEIIDGILDKQLHSIYCLPFFLSTINNLKNVSDHQICSLIQKSVDTVIKIMSEQKENLEEAELNLGIRIFEGLQKVYNSSGEYESKILEQLRKVEFQSEASPLQLYTLYFDLVHFTSRSRGKSEFELNNQSLFIETKNLAPYLFISDLYSTDVGSIRKDYFKATNLFIDHFGIDLLFKELTSHFEIFIFSPIINYYLRNQILDISTFKENLYRLERRGLTIDLLTEHLVKSNVLFNIEDDIMPMVLTQIDKENDNKILRILLIVLTRVFHRFRSRKKLKFDELVKGRVREKELLKIAKIGKLPNQLKFIEATYK